MALNFPASPNIGDEYAAGGFTWTWSGTSWDKVASGNVGIPSGETADRPANPAIGDQFYNGTLGVLELYTSSGWLSTTGAGGFNILSSGIATAVTLETSYLAGSYSIESALNDVGFDVYLFNDQGSQVGYSSSPSIIANDDFSIVKIIGTTAGDVLTFSPKTTIAGATITDDFSIGPYVSSISQSDMPSIDDTVTVTGGNFATNVEVFFVGENGYSASAKSVVRASATQLIVTRPDNMVNDNEPYKIRVVNPGTSEPIGSFANRSPNLTAGNDPQWLTSSGNLGRIWPEDYNSVSSFSVAATDEDLSLTYTLQSGQLPAGFTLNASTGEISGTATSTEGQRTFTIRAEDPSGNFVDREFGIFVGSPVTGGTVTTSGNFRIHTFESSGTFATDINLEGVSVMVVAGGGGGGRHYGAGGGAGGLLFPVSTQTVSQGSWPIVVGGGGSGGIGSGVSDPGKAGTASSALDIAATGGGGGGTNGGVVEIINGGSGGGAGSEQTSHTYGTGITGQGNDGGAGSNNNMYRGGGGGGAGSAGASGNVSGNGGSGSSYDISGTQVVYAAGGGGGAYTQGGGTPGIGGNAQGNNGGSDGNGGNGLLNRGHGGGGGGGIGQGAVSNSDGGNGGSGVVIIRYPR